MGTYIAQTGAPLLWAGHWQTLEIEVNAIYISGRNDGEICIQFSIFLGEQILST